MLFKRIKGLFIILIIGVLFTSCTIKSANVIANDGSISRKNKSYKFGVVFMNLHNPFFKALNRGIESVISENGDKLITLDPQSDVEKQIICVEELISQKVDLIFLNPIDWKTIKPALEEAKKADIPVIIVDNPAFDEDLVENTIASDNYNAGVLVAKDMMKRKSEGNIAILDFPLAKSAIDRVNGFKDTIAGNDNFKIVAIESSDGILEKAMPVMEKIINTYENIDIVFGHNDPTAIGAIAALEHLGKKEGVLVYGVDGSSEAIELIEAGIMTATVAQFPLEIGIIAARDAYRILEGQMVESSIKVPVKLVNSDNVKDFSSSW
ncbi:MAG: sugar ABC transporter substrate-binding protein [Clostridiaceae bacterium]|nr:sugar ABC transporter substrate-binding protein [Clostridiaceae bacterium]